MNLRDLQYIVAVARYRHFGQAAEACHAGTIIELADAMTELARSQHDPLSGVFRLGVIPTLGPYLIPGLFERLRQQCPKLELIMTEAVTEQISVELEQHRLDAIILATDVQAPDLVQRKLFQRPGFTRNSIAVSVRRPLPCRPGR